MTQPDTTANLNSTRDGFGLGLLQAAQLDDKVVGLCADLTESTRMQWFAAQFADRFFQVGVAEQNLIGMASGLAAAGLIPFAASYACFSPANSWGVIRTSVCYNDVNVKIVGGHAGLATGEDGATHQSLEDIATMRVLPNMTVLVPSDGEEARQATIAAAQHNGPVYIRTSKLKSNVHEFLSTDGRPLFEIGKAQTLLEGTEVTLIACGVMVERAVRAAKRLELEHISTRVVNMSTIKPIDASCIKAASQTRLIVSLEDHSVIGGLGSAIAEVLSELSTHPPLIRMGVHDHFGQSGPGNDVLDAAGLAVNDIVSTVRFAVVLA